MSTVPIQENANNKTIVDTTTKLNSNNLDQGNDIYYRTVLMTWTMLNQGSMIYQYYTRTMPIIREQLI